MIDLICYSLTRLTHSLKIQIGVTSLCRSSCYRSLCSSLLHDERYFSNSYSFIPERWIESERGNETCVKEAWIPFSYGKWNCIGKLYCKISDYYRLAMMETRVTFSKLIWGYDIALKNVKQKVPALEHRALASGPLEVRLKKVVRGQN